MPLCQRFSAAFLAISFRFFADMPAARAFPPMRPSATAAAFLPSSVITSSIWPVAIRMTWTALPITSRGRRSPLGPRGLADQCLLSKQPSQLGFLPPEGVNDIDGGLCHFRPLGLLALLIGSCLAVSIPQKDIEDYPDDARFNSARVVSARRL